MISHQTEEAILTLHQKGVELRQISRLLKVSRNTVRRVVRGQLATKHNRSLKHQQAQTPISQLFPQCKGNVVRLQELLMEKHHISIPYSTLARMVRQMQLRQNKKRRVGSYSFGPGEEMQHDTSPHRLTLGAKPITAQCAALVLSYSRMLFIQYYPTFSRFEAKVFLTEAFRFMDGTCPRCIIDNTSVIVAHGSGPNARMAPEMEAFGHIFDVQFRAHAIGHADRKARVENPFAYVEGNFLAGRSFTDWQDLNHQARSWCEKIANPKPKRSLGMSPQEAYLLEKPHLTALPPYIPPVYQSFYRVVDVEGYVHLDTNRYSAPERLIGKQLEVQKHWDRVLIFFQNQKVADHPRLIGKRRGRLTDPRHHQPLTRKKAFEGPSAEEKALCGHTEVLDRYVGELKKRSKGRGLTKLRGLLNLKRTYPQAALHAALQQALRYGLYDLQRLERIILEHIARDFFEMQGEDSDDS